ncbi:MAG: cytochrome P450, partial [Acidobacteria bacterium]|nr:cytochrome P450 [Acidobacteriota bacterium]
FITKLPLPQNLRFRRARARLDATIYRIIRERRADGVDRGDLLSMLLLASDTEGDGTGMSDVQLRDEALTLFLAGHETTANALTFAWYLLSQNPEAEAKMHEEIARVLGTGNGVRLPCAEDYPKLAYTEMVLAEVMRLYPPAWIVGRRALEDVDLNGWKVSKGSICLVSQWLLHRDARFFPAPEHFLPERWTPEARAARNKYCYFPFGDGPRKCIGEQFAWMEGVIVLATLAQQWRLQLSPGVKLSLRPSITLRPAPGLRMVLSRR